MTRKQIKKLAQELAELEIIHETSEKKEEVIRAEKRIMTITSLLSRDPNGLLKLIEVDEMVQEKIKQIKGED